MKNERISKGNRRLSIPFTTFSPLFVIFLFSPFKSFLFSYFRFFWSDCFFLFFLLLDFWFPFLKFDSFLLFYCSYFIFRIFSLLFFVFSCLFVSSTLSRYLLPTSLLHLPFFDPAPWSHLYLRDACSRRASVRSRVLNIICLEGLLTPLRFTGSSFYT